jgi:hypothetical protein
VPKARALRRGGLVLYRDKISESCRDGPRSKGRSPARDLPPPPPTLKTALKCVSLLSESLLRRAKNIARLALRGNAFQPRPFSNGGLSTRIKRPSPKNDILTLHGSAMSPRRSGHSIRQR